MNPGPFLDHLFQTYHRPELIDPDPLAIVRRFDDPDDREVVGLVAALLAYGRVASILNSVEAVVAPLGTSPARRLEAMVDAELASRYRGFQHRWTRARDVVDLLRAVRSVRGAEGSLGDAFRRRMRPGDETVMPALERWTAELRRAAGSDLALVAEPAKGSACKRLLLYLRWMVRKDEVDPGGWVGVPASLLVAPLDVHMHGVSRALGLTRRKQANLRTAIEVTDRLRRFCPSDPVRYDFALTRPGIREGRTPGELRASWRSWSALHANA